MKKRLTLILCLKITFRQTIEQSLPLLRYQDGGNGAFVQQFIQKYHVSLQQLHHAQTGAFHAIILFSDDEQFLHRCIMQACIMHKRHPFF